MLWNFQPDKGRWKIRNDSWKSTVFILLKEKYRSWKKTSTLKQTDDFSDFKLGMYSDTWTESIFEEYIGCVNINNSKYKEIIIGNCAG